MIRKSICACTTPRIFFVGGKIMNGFSPIYRRCRIENERVKQPISALLGDSWVHCPRSHATPYVLQFAKSHIRRTTDEWRGRSQLIALHPRIRRCSICDSSVLKEYSKHDKSLSYSTRNWGVAFNTQLSSCGPYHTSIPQRTQAPMWQFHTTLHPFRKEWVKPIHSTNIIKRLAILLRMGGVVLKN